MSTKVESVGNKFKSSLAFIAIIRVNFIYFDEEKFAVFREEFLAYLNSTLISQEADTTTDAVAQGSAPSFNDEDKHVNAVGGTQTRLPVRCDLLPPESILRVSAVLAEGAKKYGANNWKLIDTNDHINHALTHLFRHLSGDRTEPHLSHAVCRCLFADWAHHNFTQEQLDKDYEDD